MELERAECQNKSELFTNSILDEDIAEAVSLCYSCKAFNECLESVPVFIENSGFVAQLDRNTKVEEAAQLQRFVMAGKTLGEWSRIIRNKRHQVNRMNRIHNVA